MRAILVGCLLLAGCEAAELTNGGAQVRPLNDAPAGCRLIGTLREAEGGGLRSYERNRSLVETRLRNEAARIGGNSMSVVSEQRGDTDEGLIQFQTGNAGLATPNPRCTNCVLVTAHVFQCEGLPAAAVQTPGAKECAPPAPARREDD